MLVVTRTGLVWVFAAVTACCGGIPRPAPVSGAGCVAAEERLVALDCPEKATRKGTAFHVVCENAASRGHKMATDCIAGVTDCRQVTLCR